MSLLNWIKRKFARRARPLSFTAAALTDRGLVRPDNQDAILSLPAYGLFAVADGMGGCSEGALASSWVCAALRAAAPRYAAAPPRPARLRLEIIDNALQEVNTRIRAHIRAEGLKAMGATVAAFLAGGPEARCAVVVHAGDSRVYRLRRGQLRRVTRDHTVGEEMSRHAYSRREASALESRGNPLTHVLTRAVGTAYRLRASWKRIDVRHGDRLLICSDGVHDMLDDAQIAEALKHGRTPSAAARALASRVREAGAGDNYAIVCIDAHATC